VAGQQVLLDTGLLVALYQPSDTWHRAATAWLQSFDGSFVTVEPVLTEAAFFMGVAQRAALMDLVAQGWITLRSPDEKGWRRIAAILRKYADLDPDLADVCLVWLAEETGIARIVTVDSQDFGIYRIHGRGKFDVLPWRGV
jgi:predicted nucleic acid-binding protein